MRRQNYIRSSDGYVAGFLLDGTTRDMTVDGSSTEKVYSLAVNADGKEKLLIALNLEIEITDGLGSLDEFLDLGAALTNGLKLRTYDSSDVILSELTLAVDTAGLLANSVDSKEFTSSKATKIYHIAVLSTEYPLVLKANVSKLAIAVKDNLTSAADYMAAYIAVVRPEYTK